MRAFVLGFYQPLERGDHNRAICAATGLAAAARLFPDAPRADAWRTYATAVWNDWYAHRDTTENAPNYNAIVSAYLFLLAEQTGRLDLMRDPAVRAIYARWRDQVSPAGLIAGYGDGDEWDNWPALVAGFRASGGLLRRADVPAGPPPASSPAARSIARSRTPARPLGTSNSPPAGPTGRSRRDGRTPPPPS